MKRCKALDQNSRGDRSYNFLPRKQLRERLQGEQSGGLFDSLEKDRGPLENS